MGRKPQLNDAEKDILAGRVQRRVHHPNPVTADWAINWTRQAFGVTYTRSGIGKVLRSLGIKAHRTKAKTQKDAREPVVSEMRHQLITMRKALKERDDRSAIVAMDQMMFTSSGSIGRSYSAVGGYLPYRELCNVYPDLGLTRAQGAARGH